MLRITDIKMVLESSEGDLRAKLLQLYKIDDIKSLTIVRKAIDARNKRDINFVYTVDVEIDDEDGFLRTCTYNNITKFSSNSYVQKKADNLEQRVVVVGSGPAGLFASMILVNAGLKPVILEKGKCIEERMKDVALFFDTGKLNINSNIQFGEGGAGTFSDGKLTTGIKDARIQKVFDEFIKYGAKEDIKYSYKPHIGTDMLVNIIRNMRNDLIKKGAIFRFESNVTDIVVSKDRITGVKINDNELLKTNYVVLAIGNSARDTFLMLHQAKIMMESKNFSVGVRIEHLQETFDKNQYGKFFDHPKLEPVDYKLVYHSNSGRSAYTFCVCPGGYVVGAASEEGMVVTNGMSENSRGNDIINGAILVGVTPADFGFTHPLSGMYFQRDLEKRAFVAGGSNYFAPCQKVGDFLNGISSKAYGAIKPTYRPGVTMTSLYDCLPDYVSNTIREAILYFDTKIRGFSDKEALLTGVETRSSSPVRILRNEKYEAVNIAGIFPCGEGAGYAGGIMSSAVDGIKVAEAIIDSLS